MGEASGATQERSIPLPWAARIAGVGLLVMAVAGPFAELYAYPKLVVAGDLEATVHNIAAGRGLFVAAILAYFVMFACDLVVAWALYVLLAPVNRALSLLAAWLRVVYAAIAFSALANLVTVLRLATLPEYLAALGGEALRAQVKLLLGSFGHEWSMGLLLFGLYLGLLSYLVYRSGYVPKMMAVFLAVSAAGWIVDSLRPFLYPGADLGFLMVTFFGELVFMVWLLVRGGRIAAPPRPA